MRFAGQRQSYYASSGLRRLFVWRYGSGSGYASLGGGILSRRSISRIAQLRAVGLNPISQAMRVRGRRLWSSPHSIGHQIPDPGDTAPSRDTTVFPKSHFPQGFPKRPPVNADAGARGIFPYTQRAQLPQAGDVHDHRAKGRRVSRARFSISTVRNPESPHFRRDGRDSGSSVADPEGCDHWHAADLQVRPVVERANPAAPRGPRERPLLPLLCMSGRVMQPTPPPRAEATVAKEPITPRRRASVSLEHLCSGRGGVSSSATSSLTRIEPRAQTTMGARESLATRARRYRGHPRLSST